jgi:mutator protein MutT
VAKWLITFFEPFDNADSNSSAIIALKLKPILLNAEFLELPVSFQKSWQVFETAIAKQNYIGVIALGQAEGRKHISLERMARNWIDTQIPDSDGETPAGWPIIANQKNLSTRVQLEPLLGPEIEISECAGTYVCNAFYFRALHHFRSKNIYCLFIHLPIIDSQTEVKFLHKHKMPEQQATGAIAKIANRLMAEILVVAAVVINSRGQVLLAQRKRPESLKGLWEFPGGKVEANENDESALKRELKEELELEIEDIQPIGIFPTESSECRIRIQAFTCRARSDGFVIRDHLDVRWVEKRDVQRYSLVPADLAIFYSLFSAESG